MRTVLNHAYLKDKQRSLREGFPETMGLRVHRSISWIGRAEASQDDPDAKFLFLWIAFNSAYADEDEFQGIQPAERRSFAEYFGKIVELDRDERIYEALWDGFSGPIRLLMENKFVFNPFWQHHNGVEGYEDWDDRLTKSKRSFSNAFSRQNSVRVLSMVFDRLYVLRNQLVHGGSTWNSSVNRNQVKDGAAILEFLMPVFVDIMMDNPQASWGRPFYPVVN